MIVNKPPMGWNSWNTFGHEINEKVVRDMADFFVNEGYKDAGYKYIVIDDCWSKKQRENGKLVADPEKFPSGMKALADYIHSKGLKFGMYSCCGTMTCAGYPSSFDYEFVDAKTFASWGVDLLKYDFCHKPTSCTAQALYHRMGVALENCGRDILFSACNWGCDESYKWMRSTGAHMFRSTGDIFDNFNSMKDIAESQIPFLYASGPNCFNDVDMLIVGMSGAGNVGAGGCTYNEYAVHFALWCLFGAPLMMGNDLRIASPEIKALLQNKELIKIDQDAAHRDPFVIESYCDRYAFVRHLENGDLLLAYFNMGGDDGDIEFRFADFGLPRVTGMALDMTNVMTGETIKNQRDYFQAYAKAHDFVMYRCKVVKAK